MLDVPERCALCEYKKRPHGMSFPEDMICTWTEISVHPYHPNNVVNGTKPDWCSIRQMPEKKPLTGDVSNPEKGGNEFVRAGWNACIDEILREVGENEGFDN